MHVLMRTADCRRLLEDYDEALEVYEHSESYLWVSANFEPHIPPQLFLWILLTTKRK